MKRKVLSILLAIALIATMAIPAMATAPTSTADITFREFAGGDGPINPGEPQDPTDPTNPNDPRPPTDLPPGFENLQSMAIQFGSREVNPIARVFRTVDEFDDLDVNEDHATGARERSGIAVRVMNQDTATWNVALSVAEFTPIDGVTPLAGFRMALNAVPNNDVPVIQNNQLPGVGPSNNQWNFHDMGTFPNATASSAIYLSGGGPAHNIATGNFNTGVVGTQFTTEMQIPANVFQPVEGAQTILTWTYTTTPVIP